MPNPRYVNLILFLGCTGLILTALFMQYGMDLKPCALCITQRIFVILVGLIGLIGFLHNPQPLGRRVYAVTGIVAAIVGGAFSSRQLWLQSLPEDQVPACGPDLGYILDTFPLREGLELLLQGDGNCAEIAWALFGISIPGWTLVAFAGLAGINLWQLARR